MTSFDGVRSQPTSLVPSSFTARSFTCGAPSSWTADDDSHDSEQEPLALLESPTGEEVPPTVSAPHRAPPARMEYLDVVRGIAASIVALYHFALAFPPSKKTHDWLPTGELAIVIFFMLSGQVLILGFLKHGRIDALISAVIRRIPRLAFPMLGAVFVACLLADVGAFDSKTHAFELSKSIWQCPPPACYSRNWLTGLESLVLFWNGEAVAFPGGVLWTLRVELLGSVFCYALAWPLKHTVGKGLFRCVFVHSVLCLLLVHFSAKINKTFVKENGWPVVFGNYMFDFEVGVFITHVRILLAAKDKPLFPRLSERLMIARSDLWMPWLRNCIAVALIFGSLIMSTPANEILLEKHVYPLCKSGLFLSWTEPTGWYFLAVWDHVLSLVILLGVELLSPMAKTFIGKGKLLGDASFGLYLMHGIVLYAVGCPIYIALNHMGPDASFWLCFLICAPVMFLCAYAFWRLCDEPLGVSLPKWGYDRLKQRFTSPSPTTIA